MYLGLGQISCDSYIPNIVTPWDSVSNNIHGPSSQQFFMPAYSLGQPSGSSRLSFVLQKLRFKSRSLRLVFTPLLKTPRPHLVYLPNSAPKPNLWRLSALQLQTNLACRHLESFVRMRSKTTQVYCKVTTGSNHNPTQIRKVVK